LIRSRRTTSKKCGIDACMASLPKILETQPDAGWFV
jgi:hypothetical protein